jgi:hypothetical protein
MRIAPYGAGYIKAEEREPRRCEQSRRLPMNAVEFQAKIKDGAIEIPLEYRNRVKGTVRVIVLSPDLVQEPNLIDRLLADPLKVDRFQPFTREEIYRD